MSQSELIELSNAFDEIHRIATDSETLISMASSAEPFTERETALMNMAICERLEAAGVESADSLEAGIESLTKIMDNLVAITNDIIRKIKAFLKKAFNAIFDDAKSIEKKAEALLKKVEEKGEGQPKEKDIVIGSPYRHLIQLDRIIVAGVSTGDFSDPNKMIDACNSLTTFVRVAYETFSRKAAAAFDNEDADALTYATVGLFKSLEEEYDLDKGSMMGQFQLYAGGVVTGNRQVRLIVNTQASGAIIEDIKYEIIKEEEIEKNVDSKVEALTLEEIKTVANACKNISKPIAARKKINAEFEKDLDDILTSSEKDYNPDGMSRAKFAAVIRYRQKLVNMLVRLEHDRLTNTVKWAKASLDYANKSLSNIG